MCSVMLLDKRRRKKKKKKGCRTPLTHYTIDACKPLNLFRLQQHVDCFCLPPPLDIVLVSLGALSIKNERKEADSE